ncbi:restriction endonuclease subunit S [Corynebacterium sp. LK2590]|uniref:restriction endonuclease subunit S n=1 Tax=unclassified Corynebacterium TaxID=2624378 RepID=UPI0034CDAF26
MSTLKQLLDQYCPDGVDYVRLKDVAVRQRGTAITAGKMQELDCAEGDVTVFAAGSTKATVMSNNLPEKAIHRDPSIVVKARGYVDFVYYDEPFTTKSELWSYRAGGEELNIRFGCYVLQENSGHFQEIARLNGVKLPQLKVSDTDSYLIPLPPREVQDKIVNFLDVFASVGDNLGLEVEQREKQFHVYREQIFSEICSTSPASTLAGISDEIKTGATPKAGNGDYYEYGTIPWLRTSEINFNRIAATELCVTDKALAETAIKWVKAPSVVVAISGATAGKSAILDIPATTNQHCCCMHIDESVGDYRYVFHWTAMNYSELKSLGRGARGDLNMKIIKSFEIPLPPLSVQQDIADKLDTMQALIDNLKHERDLRGRQFEYYRSRLLDFTAKESEDND